MIQALNECEIEFDDLGYSYYAGMRNTPWCSNALDVSLLGPAECIGILKNSIVPLENAISKALRTNESGLILHKLYLLENDILGGFDFASNDERFAVDLEMARCVCADIIRAGERLGSNAMYTCDTPENNLNDMLRDCLVLMGYSEVKDQTRHGSSASGLSSGEVDILLCKDGREIAILEGLKLGSSKLLVDSTPCPS